MKLNVKKLVAPARRIAGKAVFKVKKHSPEILLGTGIVAIVGGTVMACKATLKADTILDEFEDKKNRIEEAKEAAVEVGREYSEKDQKKDLAVAYRDMIFGFGKLYAPSALVGAAGIACILMSHNIMHKRNLGLIAAYTTLEEGFKKYRKKVVEKIGEDAEYELRTGKKSEKHFVSEVDESGNETVKEKAVPTMDKVVMDDMSDYGRVFSRETSAAFVPGDPLYNRSFLKGLESQFNDLLQTRGYVFLSEVYKALGFEITPASVITGWIKDSAMGDNYVSFGNLEPFFTENSDKVLKSGRVVKAYAPSSFYLDFNVDGVIWNLI